MADNAAVFIDGGYFDYVLNRYDRPRIDYEKFSDTICQPERRLRTYWYHCPPYQGNPATNEEAMRFSRYQKFVHRLNLLNRVTVREGRLQKIGGEFRQKGVDVLLAIDLVKLAHTEKIDRAILITGDSDFVPVIDGVEGTGVTTALYYCPELPIHQSLLEKVDERFVIDRKLLLGHLRP